MMIVPGPSSAVALSVVLKSASSPSHVPSEMANLDAVWATAQQTIGLLKDGRAAVSGDLPMGA